MKLTYLANILFSVLFFTKCNAKSYKDHSLVHATPADVAELEFFKELHQFYNVTFWRKPTLVNRPVEFSISRSDLAELRRDTKDMSMDFFTVIRDLQSAFDNQTIKPYIRRKMESFDWKNYHSVDDIYSWLRDLSEMHPKELTLNTIGRSVENRNILAVIIRLNSIYSGKRSKIMIEGGCHAREWISPAFVTYMIYTILNAKNSKNPELKKVAFSYEWFFIPLLNPDGYAYSQTTDRMWRKNHHVDHGVDLNRNFGIAFGKQGSELSDKQDEVYCGPVAFSEPETASLASFAKDHSENLEYYVAFHSYGQYIVLPYAFSTEHFDNFQKMKILAESVARRSKNKYGISYTVGTSYDTVGYLASGISADWIKRAINVTHVATIELPDQGQTGFALPPSEILRTCEATMDMLLTFFSPQHSLREQEWTANGMQRTRYFGTVIFCNALLCILNRLKYEYLN